MCLGRLLELLDADCVLVLRYGYIIFGAGTVARLRNERHLLGLAVERVMPIWSDNECRSFTVLLSDNE